MVNTPETMSKQDESDGKTLENFAIRSNSVTK